MDALSESMPARSGGLVGRDHVDGGGGTWVPPAVVGVLPLMCVPGIGDSYYWPKWLALAVAAEWASFELFAHRREIRWARLGALPGAGALGAFSALLVASTLASPHGAAAWLGSPARHTGLLAWTCAGILFVHVYLRATAVAWERTASVLFAIGCAVAALAVAQHFGAARDLTFLQRIYYRDHAGSTVGNPNALGAYLVIVLLTGVYLTLTRRRWWCAAGTCLAHAGLLASETRSAWIAAALALAGLAVAFRRRRELGVLLAALGVVTAALLWVSPALRLRLSPAAALGCSWEAAGSGRGLLWTYTWRALVSGSPREWLLGSGLDAFGARVVIPVALLREFLLGVAPDKAHDQWLELAMTAGIPAAACLAWFEVRLLAARRRGVRGTVLSAILLAYLVQAVFNFDSISVLPVLAIVLGFLAQAAPQGPSYDATPPPRSVSPRTSCDGANAK